MIKLLDVFTDHPHVQKKTIPASTSSCLQPVLTDHVLICGDFNQPGVDCHNEESPEHPEDKATLFLEAVRDAFLFQHVKQPTHYRGEQTPNILDLVMSNEEDMVPQVPWP